MPRTIAADALDLSDFIRPGDTVLWGQACGEPLTLTETLMAQRHALGRINVFVGISFSDTLQAEQVDFIDFTGLGGTGSCRRLTRAGLLDILPLHLSAVDHLVRIGGLKVDVVLVQVSGPDERGRYSLGLSSDYIRSAIDRARVVIAEVSTRVPYTYCEQSLTVDDIDMLVHTDREPIQVPSTAFGEIERRIGEHARALIPDGATLQIGLGAIPDAILAGLTGHRDLGIHSGLVGDSAVGLIECGAVTNDRKAIDRGLTVTGLLAGTRRLYDFVDHNPGWLMAPNTHTHNLAIAGRQPRLVAINSAVEVDLTGQVNAEAIGDDVVGLVGGQVDFLRAAHASEGGVPMIALPSTARGGTSRIVTQLSGPVTTARSDTGVVITEHGVADLRGATLRERARRLIQVADPAHQADLERNAHALFKRAH